MDLTEAILAAVELVPPGRVVSYGDIAELVGCGPRQVGRTLARHGGGVCWWRVTNASGDLAAHLRHAASPRWFGEGIEWKASGTGCRISAFRADLGVLADAWDAQLAPDPSPPAGAILLQLS